MELTMPFLTAFFGAFFTIKLIKPLAVRIGLVDKPCERKDHASDTPLVGGIAIFVGVLSAALLWMPQTPQLRIYIIASAMMVFIGMLDDRYDLSVRVRFVAQLLIASLMIYGVGVYLVELGDLVALGDISLYWLGIPFTYLAILGAINAFNMIDGIDGLVGSMAICALSSIAILYALNGDHHMVMLPLLIAAATLPYLLFNLGLPGGRFKRIFMGDAGSMFIGLSIVWLLTLGSQGESNAFRPVTALWLIAVPLMDMAAIMNRRIRKGQSPFKADREHLHHIFMRAGFSARKSLVIISLMANLFAAIGIAGEIYQVPEYMMFVGFLGVFVAYSYAIKHIWRVLSLIRRLQRASM